MAIVPLSILTQSLITISEHLHNSTSLQVGASSCQRSIGYRVHDTPGGNIDGKPGIARFYRPRNLCTDGKTAYVMDYANNAVRAVDLKSGYTTTVFGKGADPFALEGQSAKCLPNGDCTETDGPVQTATIDNPTACVVKVGCMNGQEGMADVTLFVASDFGHTIRRVV